MGGTLRLLASLLLLQDHAFSFSPLRLQRWQNQGQRKQQQQQQRGGLSMDSNWRPETVDPLGKAFGEDNALWAARRQHELWLDLRQDENTFAQMVVHKLFYSVRRVVDEAGRALPSGARIEGVLYAEDRYDRADTLGLSNIPIYVQLSGAGEEGSAGVIVNATARDQWDPLPLSSSGGLEDDGTGAAAVGGDGGDGQQLTWLRAPTSEEELNAAEAAFMASFDDEGAASSSFGSPSSAPLKVIVLSAGDGKAGDKSSRASLLWAMGLTGLSAEQLEFKEANIGA